MTTDLLSDLDIEIAVLIPCYNEQQTIGQVIADFQKYLPSAKIYVYDNNSTDQTIKVAMQAGAIVRHEILQGKGNVVKRMFADVEADVYILIDGDSTYDVASAPKLVFTLLKNSLDMVNTVRHSACNGTYRAGHQWGNKLLSSMAGVIFRKGFRDMLSGYKIFSRRFVKSFPITSSGFEIEAELMIHAFGLGVPLTEIDTPYYARPEGSASKLSTIKDGFCILLMLFVLVKRERPLMFFSCIAGLLAVVAIIMAFPILVTYFKIHLVPRVPTAILSASLMILSFLSLTCGLILDTVTHGRREAKRMHFLKLKSLASKYIALTQCSDT